MDHEKMVDYEKPVITDHGNLVELTAGCLGGIEDDAFGTVDPINFPALSGLICE